MTRVLVLGGGPDAEREVSIASATGVHAGCLEAGLDAQLRLIDAPGVDEIRSWDADVVFPVLHGRFGEGGELQRRLEEAGVCFVGTGSRGGAIAMDKLATKLAAGPLGIPTPEACVLDAPGLMSGSGAWSPIGLPAVVKPVHEGSSVGLHLCRGEGEWSSAMARVREDLGRHPQRTYMVERLTRGRELTVGVISGPDDPGGLVALPLIEIVPSEGVYDFAAKYERDDTEYRVGPEMPCEALAGMRAQALAICAAIGVRHLARVDFLLGAGGAWSMLEVNTMPGFTASSLLPKAAHAFGLDMPMLCEHLVRCALSGARREQTPCG